MRALLRYAMLKGQREHFLPTLILFPSVAMGVPILGVALVALVRGNFRYPFTLDPQMDPAKTAEIMGMVVLSFCVLAAGTGSFWVFRSEIAARTIGFFSLARKTSTATLTVIVFGFICGVGAYALGILTLFALTTEFPPAALHLAVSALIVSALTASFGALLAGISAELSSLAPIYPLGGAAAVIIGERKFPNAGLWGLAAALLLAGLAIAVWRRRCES